MDLHRIATPIQNQQKCFHVFVKYLSNYNANHHNHNCKRCLSRVGSPFIFFLIQKLVSWQIKNSTLNKSSKIALSKHLHKIGVHGGLGRKIQGWVNFRYRCDSQDGKMKIVMSITPCAVYILQPRMREWPRKKNSLTSEVHKGTYRVHKSQR